MPEFALSTGLDRRAEGSGMTKAQPYNILITDDDPGCREALRDIF
jgi:hypothetical protein